MTGETWITLRKLRSIQATLAGLKLSIQIDVNPTEGISRHTVEDTRNALCELGLDDRSLTTHVTEEYGKAVA